jgi:hypothetical protein
MTWSDWVGCTVPIVLIVNQLIEKIARELTNLGNGSDERALFELQWSQRRTHARGGCCVCGTGGTCSGSLQVQALVKDLMSERAAKRQLQDDADTGEPTCRSDFCDWLYVSERSDEIMELYIRQKNLGKKEDV